MAFCLLNKTRTWLEVGIGDDIITMESGCVAGPFRENQVTEDLRRKIANGALILMGVRPEYGYEPTTEIQIDESPVDLPDGTDNEDKDEE